jgi:hypothetical protein
VSRKSLEENKSIIFGLVVILVVVAAYWAIYFYKGYLRDNIEQVVTRVEEVNAERDVPMEDEVLALDAKLSDIGLLLDNHIFTTKMFEFVENVTHPKVYFSSFSFEASRGAITVSGVTDSYVTFGEQYLYLDDLEEVSNVKISSVQVTKDGQVRFGLSFNIDSSIYR